MKLHEITRYLKLVYVFDEDDFGFSTENPKLYYESIADTFLNGVVSSWHGKNALRLYGSEVGTYSIKFANKSLDRIEFKIGCPWDTDVYEFASNLEWTWHKAIGHEGECYISIE